MKIAVNLNNILISRSVVDEQDGTPAVRDERRHVERAPQVLLGTRYVDYMHVVPDTVQVFLVGRVPASWREEQVRCSEDIPLGT